LSFLSPTACVSEFFVPGNNTSRMLENVPSSLRHVELTSRVALQQQHQQQLHADFDETTGLAEELQRPDKPRSEAAGQPLPKLATWQTAGWLMVADVVGVGIMGLATAFAQLGWVLAIVSLVGWYAVNMYVGVIVAEARTRYPSDSFMEMALKAFGPEYSAVIGFCVYLFLGMILGDYVLIIGETLQMVFYDVKLCAPLWMLLGTVCLVPLTRFRLLGMTNTLMLVNVVAISLSVMIALGSLTGIGRAASLESLGTRTELVASNLTAGSFFTAQALFAFAYMGVTIYLEIISEMQDPAEFKWSLLGLSGPVQFCLYLLTGAWGYAYLGNGASGLLIALVPEKNLAYRLSAVCLFVHMLLTYLVKGTVLARAVHRALAPSSSRDFSSRGDFVYTLVANGILVLAYIMANLIPFFNDLTSLLGALQAPVLGFIVPVLFVLKARRDANVSTSRTEWTSIGAIVLFVVLLFFIGIADSLSNIIKRWDSYGKPFECNMGR
jgi:amino acid permease